MVNAFAVLTISLFCFSGCSKEKLTDLANTVQSQGENLVKESKKMTDSLVETAKEQLPETGKITIRTPEPIEIEQAVVKLHVVGDGRKHSLQITSYPSGAEANFRAGGSVTGVNVRRNRRVARRSVRTVHLLLRTQGGIRHRTQQKSANPSR